MRATPGLDRGRSNHALTPVRALSVDELEPALGRAEKFARGHGIRLGVQISPEHLHRGLERELDTRAWELHWPTLVMAATPRAWAPTSALEIDPHASPAWLEAWSACEGRADVGAHADTVFASLRGQAWFARRPDGGAVAIAVPGDGLLGLFCIAVAQARRRTGLGRAIVEGICAQAPEAMPYLQVEARNAPAIALYEHLGFAEIYRYRHRRAPVQEQTQPLSPAGAQSRTRPPPR